MAGTLVRNDDWGKCISINQRELTVGITVDNTVIVQVRESRRSRTVKHEQLNL